MEPFTNTAVDGASNNGADSVAVGPDGTAYIVYDYGSDNWSAGCQDFCQGIGLASCINGDCSTAQITAISNLDGIGAGLAIGADGNPVIAYEDSGIWQAPDSATDANGQFQELDLFACSPVCRSNGQCVQGGPTNADQTWHIGSSKIVQKIGYYCDHVTVNGN